MPIKTKPDFKTSIAHEIPQAGADFEKALKASEKALAEERKNGDLKSIDLCLTAIKAVGHEAEKALKANKKDKDAVAFLKLYGPLVTAEVARLEQARKAAASSSSDDGETSDASLCDPDHLAQCIKLLRNRELNFACGVHSKAEQSRIIFDRKKAPKRLFQVLKSNKALDLPVNRLTFGVASPAADDNSTMVLSLDPQAEQPPAIIKKLRKLLRKRKEEYKPFRDVKVMVGGRFVDDIPDPQDTEPDDEELGATAQTSRTETAAAMPPAALRELTKKKSQLREARQLWERTREKARNDVLQVKAALRTAYRRDAAQLPLVMQKVKLLDAVLDDLPGDLRKALDNYLKSKSNDKQDIDRLASQVSSAVRRLIERVTGNQLLSAIDDDNDLVPNLKIQKPLLEALSRLSKAIAS